MRRLLLAAALVALVAAAPLKVETADDFSRCARRRRAVTAVSFLQTAPAEPSSAAAAATPFYDPLMLGMMGFYRVHGLLPVLVRRPPGRRPSCPRDLRQRSSTTGAPRVRGTPFFNPYFSWWGGYGWWYRVVDAPL